MVLTHSLPRKLYIATTTTESGGYVTTRHKMSVVCCIPTRTTYSYPIAGFSPSPTNNIKHMYKKVSLIKSNLEQMMYM
jgi:hypothetical protein